MEAKDLKAAVQMYSVGDMWEDAYRVDPLPAPPPLCVCVCLTLTRCGCVCVCVYQVAKTHGGGGVQQQVAYLWARSLGGEAAVKLLNKFSLLEYAIEFASDNL